MIHKLGTSDIDTGPSTWLEITLWIVALITIAVSVYYAVAPFTVDRTVTHTPSKLFISVASLARGIGFAALFAAAARGLAYLRTFAGRTD